MGDSKVRWQLALVRALWGVLALLGVANYICSVINGNQLRIIEANNLSPWLLILFLGTPILAIALFTHAFWHCSSKLADNNQEKTRALYPTFPLSLAVGWSMPLGFKAIDASYDYSNFFLKYACSLVFLISSILLLLTSAPCGKAEVSTAQKG